MLHFCNFCVRGRMYAPPAPGFQDFHIGMPGFRPPSAFLDTWKQSEGCFCALQEDSQWLAQGTRFVAFIRVTLHYRKMKSGEKIAAGQKGVPCGIAFNHGENRGNESR